MNPSVDRYDWQRFTPRQRFVRFAGYLGAAVLLFWSLRTIEINWEWVLDAPREIRDMLRRMIPPSPAQLPAIFAAIIETINIATVGTTIAIVLALPVAYIAAANVSPNRLTLFLGKLIVVSSRSVDTLIWALLFVAIFGTGPVAGIMAIAFRSVGFLGKLIAEAIEEIDWGPIEALQAAGAAPGHVLVYGIVPQVLPSFLAISVLRWDVNIRESTVLGLVGAGGIGFILQIAIDTFRWNTVATVLLAILMIVFAAEVVTSKLRRRFI